MTGQTRCDRPERIVHRPGCAVGAQQAPIRCRCRRLMMDLPDESAIGACIDELQQIAGDSRRVRDRRMVAGDAIEHERRRREFRHDQRETGRVRARRHGGEVSPHPLLPVDRVHARIPFVGVDGPGAQQRGVHRPDVPGGIDQARGKRRTSADTRTGRQVQRGTGPDRQSGRETGRVGPGRIVSPAGRPGTGCRSPCCSRCHPVR